MEEMLEVAKVLGVEPSYVMGANVGDYIVLYQRYIKALRKQQ